MFCESYAVNLKDLKAKAEAAKINPWPELPVDRNEFNIAVTPDVVLKLLERLEDAESLLTMYSACKENNLVLPGNPALEYNKKWGRDES